ncbi:MAG: hypothetical protein HC893_11215 [Chloroflexaceae bacterium]|nr:hypothetical protein [Chloroflexaceae bacterium]NJO06148.1 hypothetical protein [Chloroflexaceae bacterium]
MVPIDSKEILTHIMLDEAREWRDAGNVYGTHGRLLHVQLLPVTVNEASGTGSVSGIMNRAAGVCSPGCTAPIKAGGCSTLAPTKTALR